jgi:hypothetical protein
MLPAFLGLSSLAFTVALTAFLFALLDWSQLFTCKDEDSCKVSPAIRHPRIRLAENVSRIFISFFGAYFR